MPNIVKTLIRYVNVDPEEMKKFLNIHGSSVSFEDIVPIPEHIKLDRLPNSSESLEAYKFMTRKEPMGYFIKNLVNLYRHGNESPRKTVSRLIKNKQIDIQLGKKIYQAEKIHGEISYFKWIQSNWGSSNPIEVVVKDDVIIMETSWSAPIPILKAIYNHFPEGIFSVVWCDEIVDVAGSMEMYHGGIEEFYAEGGSSDAMDCYYEIRRYEEEEYKEFIEKQQKKGA